MFELQTAFAGVLALFAILTYLIYRRLSKLQAEQHSLQAEQHNLQAEQHRFQFDPELYVKGWWRTSSGNHRIFGAVVNHYGDLYFANPGSTPITLMLYELLDGGRGGEIELREHNPESEGKSIGIPYIIPGLSHIRVDVHLLGPKCEGFVVSYATTKSKGKLKKKEIVVADYFSQISDEDAS